MAVSFNYVPSDIRVPLFYAELDNSMANTATGSYASLLVGSALSTGSGTMDTPVSVGTVSAAKEMYGAGSEIALMVEAFRNQNPTGQLYCFGTVLDTGTAASGSITVAGTATDSGTLAIYVGGTKYAVNVASGDTSSTVAAAIVAKLNSKSDNPVTAAVNSGDNSIVDLTAKAKGVYGNEIIISKNRLGLAGGEKDVEGITLTIVTMASGAGDIDIATVAAALGDEAYDFIGCGAACDATVLNAWRDELEDSAGRWSPTRQLYGHVFKALRGTNSALASFGSARNDQHVTIFGLEANFPEPAWLVGAAVTGRESLFITNHPARPTQTGQLVGLMEPALADRFNLTERQTLLMNGIATLYVSGGYVRIERAITTYQTNAFGDDDNSYLDSETLFTLAYIQKRLKTAITSKYPRHLLADNGTRYGPGLAIVTPSVIKSELIAQYKAMERLGIVENTDLFAKNLIVERNETDVNRVDVLLPPDVVNQLRIFAVLNQFRLQYNSTNGGE